MNMNTKQTHALSMDSSAGIFDRAGRLLFGEHYIAPMAALFGVDKTKVMQWRNGKSRIPIGVFGEIAVQLHDRKRDIPDLLAVAVEASLGPLARLYRARNIEFFVEPNADGRWPNMRTGNKPWGSGGGVWMHRVSDGERQLPDDALWAVLEFDGIDGEPFLLKGNHPVNYPRNMTLSAGVGRIQGPRGTAAQIFTITFAEVAPKSVHLDFSNPVVREEVKAVFEMWASLAYPGARMAVKDDHFIISLHDSQQPHMLAGIKMWLKNELDVIALRHSSLP